MSGDLTQMGDVLREAGRLDEALAKYGEAVEAIDKAQVPEQVKEATRRNHLFEEPGVAVARNDLRRPRARLPPTRRRSRLKNGPFEVRQQHELAGSDRAGGQASATKAEQELKQANQQDPTDSLSDGGRGPGAGDPARRGGAGGQGREVQRLDFNYAYVRNKVGKEPGTSD